MHPAFYAYVESLHTKFESLMSMEPFSICNLPKELPAQCIYLFSENGIHLYVGRTLKQTLRKRLQQHSASWAQHNQAVFAFRIACGTTGVSAGYTKETSRETICMNPVFKEAFADAKNRIRQMQVRYVLEADPLRQALLEIYVAVVLGTRYNDFETH